jgi:hypothetical protein
MVRSRPGPGGVPGKAAGKGKSSVAIRRTELSLILRMAFPGNRIKENRRSGRYEGHGVVFETVLTPVRLLSRWRFRFFRSLSGLLNTRRHT